MIYLERKNEQIGIKYHFVNILEKCNALRNLLNVESVLYSIKTL